MLRITRARRRALAHWGMEIVVVVVGVLVALAVSQWAEDRASRRRAVEAGERLRTELLQNGFVAVERLAIHQCLKAQVARLADGLIRGESGWRAPAMPEIEGDGAALRRVYRVPTRYIIRDAQAAASAGGDLAALDPERVGVVDLLYGGLARLDDFGTQERHLAIQLTPLQFAVPRSREERNAMLATLSELDYLNGMLRVMAEQALDDFRKLRIDLSPAEIADARRRRDWPKLVEQGRSKYGSCFDETAIDALSPTLRTGQAR